ncbi:MAG: NDP-sugar synthase [Candidatus Nitronauta litoralis]|uniref:NDP-sugar synthase n=1 Tax=Candidatus Nitronauta litoralis TaxID=2705533 RepID=A0A7T0BTG6_9BACT|nr:MAG: NDP-sugar synthase [Candidatus Nitronauta litoralis]
MKAMVLAAGFGTRLKPLTQVLPKPMFPILGKPVLEHTLAHLARFGIRDITVNLHHLPAAVQGYFGNGETLGIELHYSYEQEILGTAGGILKARKYLDGGPFIVMNSDIITDIDLEKVMAFHQARGSALTMVLTDGEVTGIHDPIELDENDRVVHMPGASSKNMPDTTRPVTFTGVQIIEPEIFDRIPVNQFCGTTKEIYPEMIEDGRRVYGYLHKGYWQDMGTREQYLQVHKEILDGKTTLPASSSTALPEGANIVAPVWIGKDCKISNAATIGPYAVLGKGCVVENGAEIKNTVCWERVRTGENARIESSVLATGVVVLADAEISKESIIP